jgi:hypothetical protein
MVVFLGERNSAGKIHSFHKPDNDETMKKTEFGILPF